MSTRQPRGELSQRVIWGVVMAAIAIVALWLGDWPFGLLLAILTATAGWEWGRMVRGRDFDGLFVLHAVCVAFAALATTAGHVVPASIALVAGAVALVILRRGSGDLLSGFGVLAIGFPGVSLAQLRADEPLGLHAVLFLFVVVWMTDIGGYVFGRSIGGPKLWPVVSPGKTWAGAIGGLVLAGVAGAAMAGWLANGNIAGAVMVAVMLGIAAEIGDLAESALKRRYGRKDASTLIPGHGGLLDRIDGLMAAAIVATVFAALRNPIHPAAGLLLWP